MSEQQSPYLRQLSWYDPDNHPNPFITIVGCGGVGSGVAEGLARLGIKQLFLIDKDKVAPHNVANQLFYRTELDQSKVEVLKNRLMTLGSEVITEEGWFEEAQNIVRAGGIISAVDSMISRRSVLETYKDSAADFILDVRLGGQVMLLFFVDLQSPAEIISYEKSLYSGGESTPLNCTAQGVADFTYAVASQVVRTVRKFITEGREAIPFLQVYDHANQLRFEYGIDNHPFLKRNDTDTPLTETSTQ